MTADFSHIPYEVLSTISSRIINEVRGVNRDGHDTSSKPPPGSGKSTCLWRASGNAKRSARTKT
jgi:hypothetical protein